MIYADHGLRQNRTRRRLQQRVHHDLRVQAKPRRDLQGLGSQGLRRLKVHGCLRREDQGGPGCQARGTEIEVEG